MSVVLRSSAMPNTRRRQYLADFRARAHVFNFDGGLVHLECDPRHIDIPMNLEQSYIRRRLDRMTIGQASSNLWRA